MNFIKQTIVAACAGILLPGCATIVNDSHIPLVISFSDGSSGQCTFTNKRGTWKSKIPTTGVLIRRSDDDLVYDCTTDSGMAATGTVRSEIEGGKLAASVIFWDFGITDSITDKHRTYQGNIVIPVMTKEAAEEQRAARIAAANEAAAKEAAAQKEEF